MCVGTSGLLPAPARDLAAHQRALAAMHCAPNTQRAPFAFTGSARTRQKAGNWENGGHPGARSAQTRRLVQQSCGTGGAMIPKGAFLKVVDNSGAKIAQVIWTRFQTAGVGNLVKVTIKDAKGGKVAKGQLKKAVVVETVKPTRRLNGASFAYLRNSCVLVSDKGAPLGNRIRSMMNYEFLKPRWRRLALLGKRMY
jgi:large subunit ribosomal protein L14